MDWDKTVTATAHSFDSIAVHLSNNKQQFQLNNRYQFLEKTVFWLTGYLIDGLAGLLRVIDNLDAPQLRVYALLT